MKERRGKYNLYMQKGNNKRKTGYEYEAVAAEFLKIKGYRILTQNFYTKFGEIDLIAQDGEYLVFVEVKYRANGESGHPLEAVNTRKQQRIKKAAQFYLIRYGISVDVSCRFDVIGILGEEIIHIENAFE